MSSSDEGGCMGCLFSLVKVVAVIVLCYIVISFFYNTPSSEKVRSEYTSIKGQFEHFDINNVDLAPLENQGAHSLNTLEAVVGELWAMSCSYVNGIYLKVASKSPKQILYSSDMTESKAIPCGWPVSKTSVRGSVGAFGMRLHPIKKRLITHKGVDLPCPTGTPIYATADGVIESSVQGKARQGYGQMILVNHGGNHKSRYAHLSRRSVKAGQQVKRGQVIGYVGSTGGSTGPHLHYEVIQSGRAVDPMDYINLK